MASIFKFKQFDVDQSGCAMKINTDGVLLGALAKADSPSSILDIGTGTGVIALMLAQRFTGAIIDAVEIDEQAATTAEKNFNSSKFRERLHAYPVSVKEFFNRYPEKVYDLIVSNPPFHLHSLESAEEKKSLARHTDASFFKDLMQLVANHLSPQGACGLVLPSQASLLVKSLAEQHHLFVSKIINIHSYAGSAPHRELIKFVKAETTAVYSKFVIYDEPKVYAKQYAETLKDFFTIF